MIAQEQNYAVPIIQNEIRSFVARCHVNHLRCGTVVTAREETFLTTPVVVGPRTMTLTEHEERIALVRVAYEDGFKKASQEQEARYLAMAQELDRLKQVEDKYDTLLLAHQLKAFGKPLEAKPAEATKPSETADPVDTSKIVEVEVKPVEPAQPVEASFDGISPNQ